MRAKPHISPTRSLRVEFLDGSAGGLRRVRDSNWAGECLIATRSRLQQKAGWEHFDVSGVYILIGTPGEKLVEPTCRPRVYVGQGDSVQDRLESHLKSEAKKFWQTAVVFFKQTETLNAGATKYLESRLCNLAAKAGKCTLTNANAPRLPSLSPAEKGDAEVFLQRILFVMAAFGWDFLEVPESAPGRTQEDVVAPPSAPEVPRGLEPIFEELRKTLTSFPRTEFYFTGTPDYRAKVVSGSDFRVFARLRFARNWIRLELADVGRFRAMASRNLSPELVRAIEKAYKAAQQYLSRSRSN